MNRLTNLAVSSVVVGGLAFGLVGCKDKAPSDFQKRCDKVHGKVMREDDFDTLGMAPMAFEAGKSKPKKSKKSSRSSGLGGLFGKDDKKKDKKSSKSKKSGKKSKKHDDNEWICVKDGQELFDED
ncbi:hypothetical protein SEA_STARBOW_207 [Streptomyces phage Starbow]|uniref:Lipoprotein n=3 Tax=Streptomyces virus Karimac TaxID=2846401 RepID=A0A5Q2WQ98_9CAUD|nr:hypothetical protein SEA_STARBOW_207 [Streptomyces phage Starbow]QGH79937.1 hypothetical protein SEA_BORDEAUX_208 [Streptomyces phage Bordeaux]QRI45855.1 hypothetical protein SEA_BATTUTA_208 [Streptomyces phage Battuta]UVK61024.1 hypothetical protein SEA_JIMJAM_217 [Streptomyces phage JimJam]WPH58499.1 hypothetical protein SEA_SPELLY_215 [Streptomyces phage Spelly]